MRLHLLNTGYCAASEHHLLRGAARARTVANALCALLEDERHGLTLVDTGYAPQVLEGFARFPFTLYGALTPVTTQGDWSAAAQLARLGYNPKDVRTVVVSHLHADHIGGLRDFPAARFVVSRAALEVAALRGFAALRHGFVPSLLPADFLARATVVVADFADAPLGALGNTHDLYGDGTLRLVRLPGHARGQLGVWLEALDTVLVADGAWSTRAIVENRPPDGLPLRVLFDDARATLRTLEGLHDLHRTHPQLRLIPTHCPEVAADIPPGTSRTL